MCRWVWLIRRRDCWFRRQFADVMFFTREAKANAKNNQNRASSANDKPHATRIVTAKVQAAQLKVAHSHLARFRLADWIIITAAARSRNVSESSPTYFSSQRFRFPVFPCGKMRTDPFFPVFAMSGLRLTFRH
jgi:hypothetical protein